MMGNAVLILGGYGNFGKRIATALANKNIPVIIAGRNESKARALADILGDTASIAAFDVNTSLTEQLATLKPRVVVNTCGPFQTSDYHVAEICMKHGVHYIDLADGRAFVTNITRLNDKAKAAGARVISGASTVPGLSSAVLEHFKHEFSEIDFLKFGIAPGQQAERGLATIRGIMTYVGKPLAPFRSIKDTVYGWQDIYRQAFPELGKRWMANCDIPDLDLLPQRYGIKQIQFSAGLELGFMHVGLWVMSWLVRWGLPLNLPALAKPLLAIADRFNGIGSPDGGMFMHIAGKDQNGKPHVRDWFIIAKGGYGPHIPTIPAIVLAAKLAKGDTLPFGAYPCIGLVSLAEYLDELKLYRDYIGVHTPLCSRRDKNVRFTRHPDATCKPIDISTGRAFFAIATWKMGNSLL